MSGGEVAAAPADSLAEFSYASLDADAAAVARDAADIIHGVQKAFTLEVGRQLLRVREVLPHGAYERWVQDVLDIKLRTARLYSATAQWLDGKPATVADLPPTLLYALSAPTAAAEVVQSVLAAAEAGEPLDAKVIDTRLHNAKQEALELKNAQRRSPGLTKDQHAAKKAEAQRRGNARIARFEAEEDQAKREREDRVRPLALAIATLGEDCVAELLDMLPRWPDVQALADLLRAGWEASK